MSYGMRIKNNDLKIIIDENYSNYVLYESGTLTLVFSTNPNTLRGSHSFSSSISLTSFSKRCSLVSIVTSCAYGSVCLCLCIV